MKLTREQLASIDKHIDEGLLTKRFHPERKDMCILNYTARCAFKKKWNNITMMCRGLIVNPDTGYVYSRPFKKFFNIEEHNVGELKNMKFEAWEKLDGSLGIMYWLDGKPYIATRGSFDSPQAIMATEMLQGRNYSELSYCGNYTVLFEIIYPDNQIVVDYGDREDLVIIAVVEDESGNDSLGYRGKFDSFATPAAHEFQSIGQMMKSKQTDNAEGYVLKFENGLRVKFKFDEYKSLHKLIYQTTNKSIWERLRSGEDFAFLNKQNIPNDLKDWIWQIQLDITHDFWKIKKYCQERINLKIKDRKELADIYKKTNYPGIMFSIHDGKNYKELIWKKVKPKDTVLFKQED